MQTLQYLYQVKKSQIQKRLQDFKNLPEEQRIKEFVFCLLTPQSNAQRCWQAVEEIFSIPKGNFTEQNLVKILSKKTRFHNTKAKRVLSNLEKWPEIKKRLSNGDSLALRNFLAEEINGYGLKESGHFLRNIGLSNNQIAILDRHILRNLKALQVIQDERIKSKKNYLEVENAFIEFSKKVQIPIDELDLLWWSQENGEIFK